MTLAPAPDFTAPYADLIGIPFALGGRGPETLDCYGLISEMLSRCGKQAPDYSSPKVQEQQQAQLIGSTSGLLWERCEAGPGAIATIRIGSHISHVGFLLPFGRLIHSWERSGGVCVERTDIWTRRITGYYRIPQ